MKLGSTLPSGCAGKRLAIQALGVVGQYRHRSEDVIGQPKPDRFKKLRLSGGLASET